MYIAVPPSFINVLNVWIKNRYIKRKDNVSVHADVQVYHAVESIYILYLNLPSTRACMLLHIYIHTQREAFHFLETRTHRQPYQSVLTQLPNSTHRDTLAHTYCLLRLPLCSPPPLCFYVFSVLFVCLISIYMFNIYILLVIFIYSVHCLPCLSKE